MYILSMFSTLPLVTATLVLGLIGENAGDIVYFYTDGDMSKKEVLDFISDKWK